MNRDINRVEFLERLRMERLSQDDQARLDLELEAEGQVQLAAAVRAIPTDEPSMVWRSQLNEKLDGLAVRQQRQRRWISWMRPTLGLACAAALAWVGLGSLRPTVLPGPDAAARGSSLEAALVSEHAMLEQAQWTAGTGLTAYEYVPTDVSRLTEDEWTEGDLGAL